jgi:4-cresol dehydrogenase (hydroxylating) flavoprotein subunit
MLSGKMALLESLRVALGEEFVTTDPKIMRHYGRTTLSKSTTPIAVAKPKNTMEVIEVVKIANRFDTGIYPISRGKNWGYGSACAVCDGQVILDLSRMNSILEVNEDLAYALIEPGVTQIQLIEYLHRHNLPLWLDCTGSGPDSSILGNTLERGFGHTPYGDHFLHSCGMEIVLGDGRMLKTGFGHYDNSKATHVFKYGIGPYIDGIFTQSNFGIVVKLGIWLMPKPQCCKMFFCSVSKEEDLHSAIESLRPLKLGGQIKSLVHIGNDLRVISSFQRYPWERANDRTPLTDDVRRFFRKRGGFGAWNISGAIYGSAKQVSLNQKELRTALKGIGKIRFIGNRGVAAARFIAGYLEKFRILGEQVVRLRSIEKVYGLLTGTPTDAFLFGTLWRVKGNIDNGPIDPLAYDAGLMWISPILPMTGKAATDLMAIVNPIFRQYGFEPLITVSLITERAMVCVITISFDKKIASETEKAEQCYEALFELMMSKGYIPYRTNIFSMKKLMATSETYWDIIKELKQVLDPNNIIAPGRYQPHHICSEATAPIAAKEP